MRTGPAAVGSSLASRLAAAYVTAVDPEAAVNVHTWAQTAADYARLAELLRAGPWRRPAVPNALDRLQEAPADSPAHRALVAALERETAAGSAPARLIAALNRVEHRGLVRYHLGGDHVPPDPGDPPETGAERVREPAAGAVRRHGGAAVPDLAVVVPLRARPGDHGRLRNALACLAAANLQSLRRDRYRVVVVEQDGAPRCRELVADLADTYVFAFNPGTFNKSWAINIGALSLPRARHICVLDADVVIEHDHLAGIVRDLDTGPPALLPFGDLLYLDRDSSGRAVRQRLGAPGAVRLEHLRGFGLRDVWGACVCVTAALFDGIGGYDERFRGWGDEDNEFYRQLLRRTAVPRWDRPLPHLWHTRPVMSRADGRRPNQHLARTPRPPDADPIGRPDKYRHEQPTRITDGVAST
ncbi:galactosyltransferase-related protein [Streptomonospora sediminis]